MPEPSMVTPMADGWQFWIDRGGTFTDIVARDPAGRLTVQKLLSTDPDRPEDAALAGIRRALDLAPGAAIPPGLIDAVKMGTTVATNALLERRGAPTLLLVNRGFADALVIGNQARPRLFDLHIVRPPPLYHLVAEIAGRMGADGSEIEPLDDAATRRVLQDAVAAGITACAIALLHGWRYPSHEQRLATLAAEAGFSQISISHAVSPLLRLIPRAQTTVADAYLSPVLARYVDQAAAGLPGTKLYFMQSHGGLARPGAFSGKDAVLSGPAGGIVGAARTAAQAGYNQVIGFDMGGTSTDVALYDGAFERSSETEIAGIELRTPMLAIHTVAAGGGSILHHDGGRFRVGPDSAGADPGPASYRRGGPLTVTDANILLGRLQPAHFPALFGSDGTARLDQAAVQGGFATLAGQLGPDIDPRDVAEGFLRIAVANMAQAVRQVSVQKGHDPQRFVLASFGGAGGQHACLVADELGIGTIFIHRLAGVLSAYGMGLADQSVLREQAVERPLDQATMPDLAALADRLADAATAVLLGQDAAAGGIRCTRQAHLRYQGSEASLPVPFASLATMRAAFSDAHRRRFGVDTPQRPVMVERIGVEATAPGAPIAETLARDSLGHPAQPIDTVAIWSGGRPLSAPVHDRDALCAGHQIAGPALVRETTATTVIDPGWTAEITPADHMILRRTRPPDAAATVDTGQPDPVLLELFANMFMAAAEQAGAVLQNTAQSVNIKERLDFSCAVFDATGNLIANAPHVPVHLGAMGESVRRVLAGRAGSLRPGDAVALNNPYNGGTHLPDITVITPVFDAAGTRLCCFVGSRGHHADIGGATPGSTPPFSRRLAEEGVILDDFLLVQAGRFREAAFRAALADSFYPARSPDVNVADILAQVAANQAAAQAMARIAQRYGWPSIHAYMGHVMDHAEAAVRRVVDKLSEGAFAYTMDDGAPLHVAIRIDRAARSLTVDFTGTGPQHHGNFNAPPAVTRAVVLYVFRCLVGQDIPLNDGCLRPITLVIPPGSFLAPAPGAAVVAGNTEVSQAVCNALFGALGVLACSQATMNNLLFGDATHQYYETICGGAGAGPGFPGASAVQTHMTNTRMTDPEVLELRYPVRLEEFSRRPHSGGAGLHPGGDGAIRRLRFLAPMQAVIVASRRTIAPFGLAGGAPGAPGDQWVEHPDGRRTSLPGQASIDLAAGDVLAVATPGGGGHGPVATPPPRR